MNRGIMFGWIVAGHQIGAATAALGAGTLRTVLGTYEQAFLHLPRLLLAAPNVVVMTVQAAVNAGEAYFLGWLGGDALAGVSLAFPLIMRITVTMAVKSGAWRLATRRAGGGS